VKQSGTVSIFCESYAMKILNEPEPIEATVLPSIHDIRRRAPMHFFAKADNARFAAFAVWSIRDSDATETAKKLGYGGMTAIALSECFLRESALALELCIKAVIARRLEVGLDCLGLMKVPITHNVTDLWLKAKLPQLSNQQSASLAYAKLILLWAGRYAAPTDDRKYEEIFSEIDRFLPKKKLGQISLAGSPRYDFEAFNELYKMASSALFEIFD
jgi:hypothetical protein